jgi:hypothetical protein
LEKEKRADVIEGEDRLMFYGVTFERGGEIISTAALHASDEANALQRAYVTAEAHLDVLKGDDVRVRVGKLVLVDGEYNIVCADGTYPFVNKVGDRE